MLFKTLLILLLAMLNWVALAAEPGMLLGAFSQSRLAGWEQKSFKGQTLYSLQTIDGVGALQADSRAAGSGLFKEQRIDLQQTQFLNWSWRVGQPLRGLNEQSKAGDDYAARVYVVIKGGLAFWNTKAINYVWAGNTAKDTVWPNAFAGDHAMMLALRGSEAAVNVWFHEKRNVRADLQKLFGEDIRYIDAVALMTDTDNSGGQALAYYGDIWFSRD
ncbi:DUF3047 domain-containing protein [Methylomonas albis]|uniref:DUF3047 domain-containing protein n=1 Tax=Methylomonas albis TaxID=1854563 RepID=A0ABR9D5B5_9GAMM|nr:DUF3047 domain-containing protein [Methylomonas albis]MBD9358318.1 DUF3047 domain-containing protein [Methylomonas albis]